MTSDCPVVWAILDYNCLHRQSSPKCQLQTQHVHTPTHTQIMDGQLYIRRRLYSWWEKQLTRPPKNTWCKKCHCCLPANAAIWPTFDHSNYMRNHIVFNTILMSYDYIGVKQWWKTTDIFHLVKVAIPQCENKSPTFKLLLKTTKQKFKHEKVFKEYSLMCSLL